MDVSSPKSSSGTTKAALAIACVGLFLCRAGKTAFQVACCRTGRTKAVHLCDYSRRRRKHIVVAGRRLARRFYTLRIWLLHGRVCYMNRRDNDGCAYDGCDACGSRSTILSITRHRLAEMCAKKRFEIEMMESAKRSDALCYFMRHTACWATTSSDSFLQENVAHLWTPHVSNKATIPEMIFLAKKLLRKPNTPQMFSPSLHLRLLTTPLFAPGGADNKMRHDV